MKRNGFLAVVCLLVFIFSFSYLITNYVIPSLNTNKVTFSQTTCLTERVTDDMSIYDIAKLYRDSNATVEIIGSYSTGSSNYSVLGSGVVVASTGYKTTSLDENIEASRGSYVATNYHVVEFMDESSYSNKTLKLRAEDEVQYPCSILWSNKNLDIAVVYAEVSYNYVTMVDRWIDCDSSQRLDYEEIFTIGSPLEMQYLNRLTIGNIASNNEITMFTGEDVYTYTENGDMKYSLTGSYPMKETTVVDNVYEEVIDIALGISGGNSGGGCFDAKGNLFGLTTLGTTVEQTDGNQMNGVVPIYPVMKVLDKLIANNETSSNYKIFTISDLGIVGLDSLEAYYSSYVKKQTSFSHYFINGKFYSSFYDSIFDFEDDGYCVITNSETVSSLSNMRSGAVIASVKKDGQNSQIKNRNDLLYFMLTLNEGDSFTIYYKTKGLIGDITSSATIQF